MSTLKKQTKIPKFHSETEEAKWWDAHPEAATQIMKRALQSGAAKRAAASASPIGRSHQGKRSVPLKAVTMRLPEPDIQTAQDLAHKKGLPYRTYIQMLLHEALKREGSA